MMHPTPNGSPVALGRWFDSVRQDIRFALRAFRSDPLFTATAVLTLGLGIAATTSVVSVVDATLLRPLPFPSPDRVVDVSVVDPMRPDRGSFGVLRAQTEALGSNPVFESVGEYASWVSQPYTMARPDGPQVVSGVNVTPGFFTVFRVRPARGRAFTPDDEHGEQPGVCILTATGVRRLFDGERDVLGRTLTCVEGQLTVVGVMGEDFWYPMSPGAKSGEGEPDPDLLVPIARRSRFGGPDSRWAVAARLRPGAGVAEAQRGAEAVANSHPDPGPLGTPFTTRVQYLQGALAADGRPTLLTLLGFAGCLLLVCCVNIANLLLSHATGRTRELALRTTLGAGRLRVFRQLLTEHLVLAGLGGLAGLYLTVAVIDTFVALLPERLLIVPRIGVDARVLGLAALVTLVTGVLAGLGPAIAATRSGLAGALKAAGHPAAPRPRWRSFASVLLVVEAAALLILLSGGGLLVNTLVRLKTIDLGFDPDRLWTAQLMAPKTLYAELPAVGQLGARAADALRRLPGVVAVGESDWGLLGGFCPGSTMTIPGRPGTFRPQTRHVSAGYFAAVNMPLTGGRLWDARDEDVSPKVVVINQAAAREYWPDEDPVGRRVVVNEKFEVEVVGVVRDLREADERTAPGPSIYVPLNPSSTRFYRARTLVVRTSQAQAGMDQAVVKTLAAIDPRLPVTVERSDATMSNRRQDPRFYAVVVGVAAAFGLLLAAVGIGGVTAHGVGRRTREIGVRLALGAEATGVVNMVVRQVCTPVAIGVALGVLGALALSRVLASFLYEVTPQDPVTHGSAVILLVAVALLAAYVPARRAARINPVDALRAE